MFSTNSRSNTRSSISSSPSSTFTNTVTDDEGCTGISTITIAEPTLLTASLASQTPTNCFGESNGTATIAVPATGTAPYTYNGGASTTITGLNAGTHTITVKDANNCDALVEVTITQPTAVSASITSQTPTNCFGSCDGSAIATPVNNFCRPFSHRKINIAPPPRSAPRE